MLPHLWGTENQVFLCNFACRVQILALLLAPTTSRGENVHFKFSIHFARIMPKPHLDQNMQTQQNFWPSKLMRRNRLSRTFQTTSQNPTSFLLRGTGYWSTQKPLKQYQLSIFLHSQSNYCYRLWLMSTNQASNPGFTSAQAKSLNQQLLYSLRLIQK